MGKYQKNIEAARRISVVQYLETYHPGELVRKTDKEYRTKTHSSLVITPANGLFHWYAQSVGGNNAIDYLTKVEGMDFVSAVRLLSAMAPAPVSIQTAKASSPQQHTTRPFELPAADRNAEAATITTAPCCGKPTTARQQSAATFCCVRIFCCSADTSSRQNSYGKTILKLWMNCWPTRKMQKSKSNSLPASAKFCIAKNVSRNVPRGKKKSNH